MRLKVAHVKELKEESWIFIVAFYRQNSGTVKIYMMFIYKLARSQYRVKV